MILLYSLLSIVILFIVLTLIIPIKVKIDFNMSNTQNSVEEDLSTTNKIDIYILRFIKVKTIDMKQKDKIIDKNAQKNLNATKNNEVVNDISKIAENFIKYEKKNSMIINKKDIIKLKESMSFEEFYLILGFNLKEPLINAYLLALFNSLINIYMAKNVDKFNFENVAYKTYISNKIIDFKFYSIINFKLVNTIIIIIKIILKLRKVVNKNG